MSKYKRLKNPNVVPPSRWTFEIKETGFVLSGVSLIDLITKVSSYLASNDKKIPANLPHIVEDYICSINPESMTLNIDVDGLNKTISGSDVDRMTHKILVEWRNFGGRKVGIDEAERRSRICLKCPQNIISKGCTNCGGMKMHYFGWIRRRTKYHNELQICHVAAIMNTVQVHIDGDFLGGYINKKHLSQHPEECWKRKL